MQYWSMQEDAVLERGLEEGMSDEDLSRLLDRSLRAVEARRHRLRLLRSEGPPAAWSPAELAALAAGRLPPGRSRLAGRVRKCRLRRTGA